jgi:hypothetical protein
MKSLKEELATLLQEMGAMEFSDIILKARQNLGIPVCKLSLYSKIPINRLRRIEHGSFKTALEREELKSICKFYDLPFEEMQKKMNEHLKKNYFETKAERYFSNLSEEEINEFTEDEINE